MKRWREIDELLQSVLQRPPEDRKAFLAEVCRDDPELLREADSLVAHYEQAGTSLEGLPASVAVEMAAHGRNPLMAGSCIAHYQLRGLLGTGGMGDVYLAQDKMLGREVALKVLPAPLTNNPEHVQRFEQEARAASALNHPNIVTIHQIGQADGTYFIVTEFIEGQTLRRRMAAGPLTLLEVIDIAIQVTSALDSAHAAGIVHRDIKPENIMLRPDGLVKVLDFGLAKLAAPPSAFSFSETPTAGNVDTEIGILMGTPRYMSPEQVRGQKTDAQTDIFSLGVVIYEMATGRAPFTDSGSGSVLEAILKDEPPPIAEGESTPEFENTTKKALAKDLKERYGSAKELGLDLKRVRQDVDHQRHTEVSAQPNISMSRRKVIRLSGAVLAAALSGFMVWQFWPHDTGIRSLAVLPFENATKDEDADWLSTGITESLIRQIQQLPALEVMAFSTVLNFKGKPVDPRDAGRRLGVSAIVTGRVLLAEDRVTITAELVEVANGARLWGGTYERSSNDILHIQDEIAQAIVNEGIQLKLSGGEQSALAQHLTDNPEAHELYLRARRQQEMESEEGYLKARELLKEAIKCDPRFALAYVALAGTYSASTVDGFDHPRDAWREHKYYIEKAAELDPSLPGVHLEQGARAFFHDWDWATAEREFAHAIGSNRRNLLEANYFSAYGLEQWALGHPERALQLVREARLIDPLSPSFVVREAHYLLRNGLVDDAIELYSKVIYDTGDGRAYPGLADAFAAKGEFDKALDIRRRQLQLDDALVQDSLKDLLSTAQGSDGYRRVEQALARIIIDRLNERAAIGNYVSPLDLARAYAGLGDKDQAFRYLDAAVEERSPGLVFLNVDPQWKVVRDDRRFREAVARMGLIR